MKVILFFVMAVLVCIISGCKSHCINNQKDQSRYRLQAMFVDAPFSEYERTRWEASSQCIGPSNSNAVDELLRSTNVNIVRLPSLTLRVGKTKEASNQHAVQYPVTFDNKGKPEKLAETGVGQKIRALISEAKDSTVTIDVFCEDVKEPNWIYYNLGNGLPAVKQPVFHSRSMTPNITLHLNTWLVMGGLVSDTNAFVFLMKVDKE